MVEERVKPHNVMNFMCFDEIEALVDSAEFEEIEGVSREFKLYPTDYEIPNEDLTSASGLISRSQWIEERFRAENWNQLELELQTMIKEEELLINPVKHEEEDLTNSSSTDFLFSNRKKLSLHKNKKSEELIEVFQRNQNQKANAVLSNSKNLVNKKAG